MDSFRGANLTAKNQSSFHPVLFWAQAHITPSIWSNMRLYTVMTWCNVTGCLFYIDRVQYLNCLKTCMRYITMVCSSWVVKSGRYSLNFGFWSCSRVNSRNRSVRSTNSSVSFPHVFTSIIGSMVMWNLAFWQSMNSFQQPGVSGINTPSILCYMKVNFSTFKISWNRHFLNYLSLTWSHGWHLIDSSIALFSKSLTLPNVYAFILSKLLIALMVFPRLGAAFYTKTAHKCAYSQLYDVCHAWYVVPQCRPLDCRGLKCWLQLACHQIIWQSIISRNTKEMAVRKLKTIKHVPQMYG